MLFYSKRSVPSQEQFDIWSDLLSVNWEPLSDVPLPAVLLERAKPLAPRLPAAYSAGGGRAGPKSMLGSSSVLYNCWWLLQLPGRVRMLG